MRRAFRFPELLTANRRGIAFGGDYNPDQWSESVWVEDIRLMKQAGVNVIALGIFSWDRIQPTEDTWDFAWLDKIIDMLGDAGIAVDLASATASAPLWLYNKHPEVLPQDNYGHTIHAGSRQSWSPTSPIFKKYALEMCKRLAERYGKHPAVTAWHIGNEYGWNNRFDYSEDAVNAWREWLRERYGTVDAVNAAWGAAFWSQEARDFNEIDVPRHMGADSMVNPAKQFDFDRFCSEMLREFFCAERDMIASICPDTPITTNFMISTDQCAMDYARWARDVDFVSNDHYFHEGESHLDELACSDALVSALACGKPWYLMEHSTSAVQWKPLNARKRRGELTRDAIAHVALGADAINFFQWRQSASGAEMFHSAMLPHAGEDSKLYRQVCELGSALATLSDVGVDGSLVHAADTAILFAADSEWATECATLPSTKINHWHDVRDWYRALLDVGTRADVVPLDYNWSQYSTVIVPTMLVLSGEQTHRLADFAANGGTVIVDYASGILDEHMRVWLGGYPGAGSGLLRDVLGVRSEEFNILGDDAQGDARQITLSNGLVSRLWQNDVTSIADDTRVIARYVGDGARDWELEGAPAITEHPWEQGRGIYIGCDLSREELTKLLRTDLAHIVHANEAPTDVLHVVRESANAQFNFYFARDAHASVDVTADEQPILAYHAQVETDSNGDRKRYTLTANAVLVTRIEK